MKLDYVEITQNVNVSNLEASADVVLTGNPISLDGDTEIKVQFYCQVIEIPATFFDFNLGLWDNDNNEWVRLLVGRFHNANVKSPDDIEANGFCYITPPAGTHTYSIRAYKSPNSIGQAIVAAGDGVGTNFPPGFYRVETCV